VSHPLDGAKAKLCWAEKHFEALGSEWQAFIDTDPYGLTLNRDLDAQTIWVFFQVLKPIPPKIALRAGDVIQNLRASLDYIVAELVEARGGNSNASQFPIHVKEATFIRNVRYRKKSWGPGPLNSIPATSGEWAFIERLQPYQRTRLAKRDPLYALNYMSNRDKHRALAPTFGAPLISLLGDLFTVTATQPIKYRWRYLWLPWNPLEHNALLGGVDFSIPPDRDTVKMDVKGTIPFDVFFDEGVVRNGPDQPYGLRRLIKHVRQIVTASEIFFLQRTPIRLSVAELSRSHA
jgi:hypothetical protein